MKCNSPVVGCLLIGLLILTSALLLGQWRPPSVGVLPVPQTNNPQKFYLWSTGAAFSHTFTYDHRATDIWLFRSAGGTMFNLHFAPITAPPATNNVPSR